MYKKIVFYSIMIFYISSCTAVDSYLDKAESGGVSEEQLFEKFTVIDGFVSHMYSQMFHDEFEYYSGFSLCNLADDSFSRSGSSATKSFYNGSWGPSSTVEPRWAHLYSLIRNTHIFLRNIDEIPFDSDEFKDKKNNLERMKGEVLYMRAYAYSELFRRYGGVPLLKGVLEISDDLNIPRASEKEVVEFIVDNCDEAIPFLPNEYPQSELGRIPKGAAMMLKARVLLYYASPLFNPENEVSRWREAAQAHREIIEMGIYELHENFVDLFHTRNSKEIIFQSSHNFLENGEDGWHSRNGLQREWGWARNQPTQNLVDAFEMKNGLPITDPNSGYDPQDPYRNRDPRLDYTVYRNGSIYKRNNHIMKTPVETFIGGLDGYYGGPHGLSEQGLYTLTGYYLGEKSIDPDAWREPWPGNPGSHYWIFFRYGETLLNFAEALNESLSSPDEYVYAAINELRSRPGVEMPPLPEGLSKEQMRERIRNERRVELAFENHRFWDTRRWKIAEDVLNVPVRGVKITKKEDGTFFHEYINVEDRDFYDRNYLWPIPQSEINKNPALEQNPGY